MKNIILRKARLKINCFKTCLSDKGTFTIRNYKQSAVRRNPNALVEGLMPLIYKYAIYIALQNYVRT